MAERTESGVHGMVASAVLVGAVGAILAAGLILATPAPRDRAAAPLPAPRPESPDAPAPEPEPEREPAAAPLMRSLAERAGDDVARIGRAAGPFTAQILVACKPETVERAVAAVPDAGALYVLPADVRGQACFRLCWGSYASAQDAAAAADLPAALRSGERISAVEIAKVLP